VNAHHLFAVLCAALALLAAGCGSPGGGHAAPLHSTDHPSAAMPMQDVRTEATILEMENQYIAEKNSLPPRPEQAAAMKKMEEKKQAEAKAAKAAKEQQAAKESEKKDPAAGK
jgi:CCR4-NOT transcriptional regulation complex NOT5 subunit